MPRYDHTADLGTFQGLLGKSRHFLSPLLFLNAKAIPQRADVEPGLGYIWVMFEPQDGYPTSCSKTSPEMWPVQTSPGTFFLPAGPSEEAWERLGPTA